VPASLVSVVIPTHNGARHLAEAIESALAQTHPAVETIVVDDGSADDTPAIIARYAGRVHALRQENRGVSAARNAGLAVAHGAYVAFLDHDDRMLPEKLAKQSALLDARPDVGIAYSGWWFIDAAGRRLPATGWSRREGDLLPDLLRLENPIFLPSVLVRRALVDAVGGFDERLRRSEDWDLWLRLGRRGVRWALVDEPLAEYRLHPGQKHRDTRRRLAAQLEILDRLFADPDLPAALRALAPTAYQDAHLRAALHHYRAGEREEGNRAFHDAVAARPVFLLETKSLLRFCRGQLPGDAQRQADVVARWRDVTGALRSALDALFARPDLEPEITRLAWRARLAAMRVTARLARKRLLGGGRSRKPAREPATWGQHPPNRPIG
jgi:glycosyltransferase involved in cell wall biosynthesis